MLELKPCGTRAAYRRGCRCESCVEANRAHYRAEYKITRLPIGTGVGNCIACGQEVKRRSKTGPVPRYCSGRCNTKHWKQCNPDRMALIAARERQKQQLPEAKERTRVSSAKRRAEDPTYFSRLFWDRKQYWVDYLGGTCPCGEKRLPCLDFDHINPESKAGDVCYMLRRHNKHGQHDIKLEVDKCQILCANCHRLKTSKNWLKYLEP